MTDPALTEDLRHLFQELARLGYQWQPILLDELLAFRKDPGSFSPLYRRFALGLSVTAEELIADGLNASTAQRWVGEGFRARVAVSRAGDRFVAHHHWPPRSGEENSHAHFGKESVSLLAYLDERMNDFEGPLERVIDLGAASGGVCSGAWNLWYARSPAVQVTAIELSADAARLGQAAVAAQSLDAIHFVVEEVDPSLRLTEFEGTDLVVFNPPMVIPEPGPIYPHRDGGHLGIELPLAFLEFSHRHLREDGEVICLTTNPISHGRGLLWDELKKARGASWDVLDRRVLNPFFNQAVARKRRHDEWEIERIELCAVHLRRKASGVTKAAATVK